MILTVASAAATTQLSSGDAPATLIELYTSEGCSSCPPADRWLSALRDDPRLWREMVPVAFHVDYWDHIGWQDPYASAAHTARQRAYHAKDRLSQVYTPGFIIGGREWRGFFTGDAAELSQPPAVGRLHFEIFHAARAELRFTPVQSDAYPDDALRYTVALLGFGLKSAVPRGENAGKELHHDFVVLGSSVGELTRSDAAFHAAVTMPSAQQRAPRYGVAVWISRHGDPTPLQATGGWISGPP